MYKSLPITGAGLLGVSTGNWILFVLVISIILFRIIRLKIKEN